MTGIRIFNKVVSLFIVLIGLNTMIIHAQMTGHVDPRDNIVSIIDRDVNPGMNLDELLPPMPQVQGTHYLEDEWQNAVIEINGLSKILKNYPARIDLKKNMVELKTSKEVKVCPNYLIKSIQLRDKKFVNLTKKYKNIHHLPPDELYEVVWESDDVKLYKLTSLDIKPSTYVTAIDLGARDHKIIKNEDYFLNIKGHIRPINKKKKKNKEVFNTYYEKIMRYTKSEKLMFKKENDLIQISQHLASIID